MVESVDRYRCKHITWADPDGGTQGGRAPSKLMSGRSRQIGSVLLALPVRLKRTKTCMKLHKIASVMPKNHRPRSRWGSWRRSPKPVVSWAGGKTSPPQRLRRLSVLLHRLRRLKSNVLLQKQFSGSASSTSVVWNCENILNRKLENSDDFKSRNTKLNLTSTYVCPTCHSASNLDVKRFLSGCTGCG